MKDVSAYIPYYLSSILFSLLLFFELNLISMNSMERGRERKWWPHWFQFTVEPNGRKKGVMCSYWLVILYLINIYYFPLLSLSSSSFFFLLVLLRCTPSFGIILSFFHSFYRNLNVPQFTADVSCRKKIKIFSIFFYTSSLSIRILLLIQFLVTIIIVWHINTFELERNKIYSSFVLCDSVYSSFFSIYFFSFHSFHSFYYTFTHFLFFFVPFFVFYSLNFKYLFFSLFLFFRSLKMLYLIRIIILYLLI